MTRVWLIARDEWRLMRRNAVAALAIAMLLALSIVATLTALTQRQASDALRARYQAQADRAFDAQPARHPHRMVHYGHFVFRPLPALAGFDSGVDAFTGSTIFLEGHRQNSANFGDVRQSSLLVRFGQLTPAFVLHVLAPLVLIFVGFGMIARERERGTLKQLQAHGIAPSAVVGGKTLALAGVALLLDLPVLAALGWMVAAGGAPLSDATAIALGHGAYLAIWVALITAVSALASQARGALLALIGLWAITVVLLPRIASDVALAMRPSANRIETDVAIQRDLRRIGDSHDPADPHFAAFKAATLARYGVSRVEDLPFNYRGLLALEGERLTAGLFDAYAHRQFAAQRAQSGVVALMGIASPTIAARALSMALAGTDLESHRRFLIQAERYRYTIVQQLNRLQALSVSYADDGARNSDPEAARRVRIDPRNWQAVPDFRYRGTSSAEKAAAALPAASVLAGWALLAMLLLRLATRRVAGAVR
jgi:ABC-2 type transport system permease protein